MSLRLRTRNHLSGTSRDVSVGCRWCQSRFKWSNAVKTFEMSIRHNRRTTRTALYWELSVTGFIFTYVQKYFSGRGEGAIAPSPLWIPHCSHHCATELNWTELARSIIQFTSVQLRRSDVNPRLMKNSASVALSTSELWHFRPTFWLHGKALSCCFADGISWHLVDSILCFRAVD